MSVIFKKVKRLCMAVENAEAAAKEYAKVYGVGPWEIREACTALWDESPQQVKSAVLKAFSYEIELLEPLEEKGIFAEYLKKNGNGLMYLHLETTGDPQEAVQVFGETGHKVSVLSGLGGGYVLGDYCRELGFYLAVDGASDSSTAPADYVIQASDQAEIHLTNFGQLGIVVKDFKGTMDLLYNCFGLGPWQCIRFDEASLSNVKLKGTPVSYCLDVSHAMMDGVEFELLAPLDTNSTFGRYLERHGNGLHHVNLKFEDEYDQVFDCFERHKTGAEQTAIVAGFEFCAFCDHTKSVGLYLEMGKVIGEPSGPPPEMPWYPKAPE